MNYKTPNPTKRKKHEWNDHELTKHEKAKRKTMQTKDKKGNKGNQKIW